MDARCNYEWRHPLRHGRTNTARDPFFKRAFSPPGFLAQILSFRFAKLKNIMEKINPYKKMSFKGEELCAWSGPLAILMFAVGWGCLAGWWTPPPPTLNATELAGIFQQDAIRIRFGMLLTMYGGGGLTLPFAAVVTVVMLRMRGPSPAWAYTQLGAGICNAVLFIIGVQLFAASAFRPDRQVEITQFGYDFGMLLFDGVNIGGIVQFASIGAAILGDENEHPAFPRWFGYVNIWFASMLLLTANITFFKTGPFNWSGPLGWWYGVIVYCLWFFMLVPFLLKAIKEHKRINRQCMA